MTKKPLSRRRSIITLDIKIMDNGKHLKGLCSKAPIRVMKSSEIAIAPFNGGGSTLKL
jgi:hypothetical protein